MLEGHDQCSGYLEGKVRELLNQPAVLDHISQQTLLNEVSPILSDTDNSMLEAPPSKEEIFETLLASNLKAAAGTDGIPGLLYKVCWEDVGETLIDVIHELFRSKSPTVSMRTALMVFSSKPKKLSCFKPSSKRRNPF